MQAVCLRHIPEGMPQVQDFELQQQPLPPLGDGQLRVQVQWLSLDPFLRAVGRSLYVAGIPQWMRRCRCAWLDRKRRAVTATTAHLLWC
ncbi:MAG: hypothetical protein ACREP4_13095 [Stenotrophomonas sp.]|uniref:hypothetical protein n=1 Tax=Stenotrophomonas sp. TaxID=69392 RepID=UPI003D6D434E